jgi:acyl transferase domain-containing protein/acyl carrier protein
VEVILTAQMLAAIEARSISYVETHGTGTPLGDPIEIAALTQAFRATTPDVAFCRLGSLKANIGHLDTAAGVAGLIKAVLTLSHRRVPPLVNFRKANPHLGLESSPFTASAEGAEWPAGSLPRRAGVSSFGIGGTNAHVVLEEAPDPEPTVTARDAHLIVLSAKSATALEKMTANLGRSLASHPGQPLADLAWTLQVGRPAFAHRRALAATSTRQAADLLSRPQDPAVHTGLHEGGPRRVAFLFSGQGSQHVGMGARLYRTETVFRDALDRCATLLLPLLGRDIRDIMFAPVDDSDLNQTHLTQPVLFSIEYALTVLWKSRGIVPAAMLGHSIGEYVAAHVAGVLTLEDALDIVSTRGRLIQELPPGSMAAVHLPADVLASRLGAEIEIAAVNAPGLCTVSGPTHAVDLLSARLASDGIEARRLHTSHAFHSAMMEPALEKFRRVLATRSLAPPVIPYVSNVTGTWITAAQATSPEYYAEHLRKAVQFESGIRTLAADPALFMLEVGPGVALTSLARLTIGQEQARRVAASLPHPSSHRDECEAFNEAVGRLWVAGAELDWRGAHGDSTPRRIPLPTYPFERERHWIERERGGQPSAPRVPEEPTSTQAFVPTWSHDDAPSASATPLRGIWLVLGASDPFTSAVLARLRERGATPLCILRGPDAGRVSPVEFRVRPGVAGDIRAVQHGIRDESDPTFAGVRLAGVIDLWSIRHEGVLPGVTRYDEIVALATGLGPVSSAVPLRIVHATIGAQSVLGEPVIDHEGAVTLGPVLVLPTEVPGISMRSVDLEDQAGTFDAEAAAQALCVEAAAQDAESLVAIRGGRRWLRRFVPGGLADPAAGGLPLKRKGIYLITGGLGGLGLVIARWLAQSVSARLLLTARTPLPAESDWDSWVDTHPVTDRNSVCISAIREIRAAGGEVRVAVADAANLSDMARALEGTRAAWGLFDGVIHAAGTAGEGRVAELETASQAHAVLSPKIGGLGVLVKLLGEEFLDFVVLMSSINSVIGAPGACSYSAANAVMDAFVDSRSRPRSWRHVVSINWGAWREVGMAVRLANAEANREQWRKHLESAISSGDGVAVLRRVLGSKLARVVVAPFDVVDVTERIRDQQRLGAATPALAAVTPATSHAGGAPSGAVPSGLGSAAGGDGAASALERQVCAVWVELLGVERIGIDEDFFALGGHSLMATRLIARLDDLLHVRLQLRDVFEAPTVRSLAQRIAQESTRSSQVASTSGDDREEIEF